MAIPKKVAAVTKSAANVITATADKKISGAKVSVTSKNVSNKAAPTKTVAIQVAPSSKSVVKRVEKTSAATNQKEPLTVLEKKQFQPIEKKAKLLANQPLTKQITQKTVAKILASEKAVKTAIKPMAKKEEVKKPETEKLAVVKPAAVAKAKDIKVPAPKAVVIPKTTTKGIRTYQPDFTKSVLDKAERDPGAPTQRYSDSELVEFRELIQRKLEAAKKELFYLHGLITRKDALGGDEGDNRYMTMEDGSLSMEREQLSQMASRQITFIDHLEKAIMRIENKTYGICRVTGKLIDKARLRAVPHATLSIEAKMGAVK